MKKRKKGPSQRTGKKLVGQQSAESRTATAATVLWMLSLVATAASELVGLLCRVFTILVEPIELLRVLGSVMLFTAVVSGFLTLILAPVVLRLAVQRPPRVILQAAIVVGALPFVVLAAQVLTR